VVSVAGAPVHGYSEPTIFHHQQATHQLRPAGFADQGQGPSLQSSGDASQLPVQDSLQLTVSQTVNDATSSFVSESELATVSEAPPSITGASGTAAENSDLPLANMKEKTPMCLINELARFNKVSFLFVFICMPHSRHPLQETLSELW